jgi:hypothetical protein
MNVLLENRDDTCRFAPENVRVESAERTAPEPTPSSDNRHHNRLPHKLLGRRKQRLKALRRGFEGPSSIRENLQVQCLEFSDDPLSVLKLQRLDMKTARTCNNPDDHCGEYDATIAIEVRSVLFYRFKTLSVCPYLISSQYLYIGDCHWAVGCCYPTGGCQ